MVHTLKTAALALAIAALVAGCGWPRVHKVTIQQGNVISQDMIDQLKPGMTRSQVAFIMGEPVLRNSFNTDRWDYLYTITVPGVFEDQKRVTLYFENDVLAYFTGDYAPSSVSGTTDDNATPAPDQASTN